MKGEIPFSFLRDIKGGEVSSFLDRQQMNNRLRQKRIPISISCLDVLISLWILPAGSRRFDGLLDDMVISPKIMPGLVENADDQDSVKRHHLDSVLGFLLEHKMAKIDKKEIYGITKKGKEIMEQARSALA